MFNIEMLPAGHGDCLLITYGSPANPYRVLIDGGPTYAAKAINTVLKSRLRTLSPAKCHIDLLIITHIDDDHLGGILGLLDTPVLDITIGDVWFNGWHHLPGGAPDELGAMQAERISGLIQRHRLPWNTAFNGQAVVVPGQALPVCHLPGGLQLTLLSPTARELQRLRATWKKAIEAVGMTPGAIDRALEGREHKPTSPSDLLGDDRPDIKVLVARPFTADTSVANGASIVVLAEFEGRSCLFAADAFAGVLTKTVSRLIAARNQQGLKIDALKLAHHGGKHNTTMELLSLLECPRYLISTSGKRFNHPDRETIARIIQFGGDDPALCFNYRTEYNEVWDNRGLKIDHGYSTLYPAAKSEGLLVKL